MAQPKLELKPGEVEIHGKIYKTVSLRISEFREKNPLFKIDTDLISNAEEIVIKAVICDDNGHQVSSGYASEMRDSTAINKTSALENCETSAIGRALACFGLAGTEYASADEMVTALEKQKADELIYYMSEVRKHFQSIAVIKQAIYDEKLDEAFEAWSELSQDEKRAIWRAPSRGGCFTTLERDVISSDEFAALNPLRAETIE